jgi:hypothetical protein
MVIRYNPGAKRLPAFEQAFHEAGFNCFAGIHHLYVSVPEGEVSDGHAFVRGVFLARQPDFTPQLEELDMPVRVPELSRCSRAHLGCDCPDSMHR